jgi:ferritin-like metal-binding protein YciE
MIAEQIAESERQVKNLERIFGSLGEEPKRRACDKAKGIVSEGRQAMRAATTTSIRDSLITGGATKAQLYELVSYADLIGGAQLLDLWEPVKLLRQNREQEARTARRLERTSPRLLMRVPV